MMDAYEVNFDGLVGPTHNYAGLSYGNIASLQSGMEVSNPKEAAKQGLLKMKALSDMGIKQGVFVPQQRPDLAFLRRLGFTGTHSQIINKVAKQAPELLPLVYSASSMWTANAATVSPSADTLDAKVHFTPANLNSKLHRAIEPPTTSRVLQAVFPDTEYFVHHKALPGVSTFGDEGAANHTRFCRQYGEQGVELFVYGREDLNAEAPRSSTFPARQTLEAGQAISRLHGLNEACVVFAQQKPSTIDAGVFHNDVIAVGNRDLLFYHEAAFLESNRVIDELSRKLPGGNLKTISVRETEVSLEDAINSYLFNSQLISLNDEHMVLVVPQECRQIQSVSNYLDHLQTAHSVINDIITFDLNQSMKNGGGPACLRLRVVLTDSELNAVSPGVLMDDTLFKNLNAWIDQHYRDRFSQADMADASMVDEVMTALDELTSLLGLPSIYPFQIS